MDDEEKSNRIKWEKWVRISACADPHTQVTTKSYRERE